MSRYQIQVDSDLCTGCLRCMLACSRQYAGRFNPSAARIQVTVSGAEGVIAFLDTCVRCGSCADNCFSGALTKQVLEEVPS